MKFTSKEDALRDLKSQYLKPSKPLSFAGISAILRYYLLSVILISLLAIVSIHDENVNIKY